jgi:hypothetical protein
MVSCGLYNVYWRGSVQGTSRDSPKESACGLIIGSCLAYFFSE